MIRDPETLDAFLGQVRRLVREVMVPREAEVVEADAVPADIVALMRGLGLFGMSIPEAHGGLGLTMEEEALVAIELGGASPAFAAGFAAFGGGRSVSRSSCTSSRWRAVSRRGTMTCTTTTMSPRRPVRRSGTPLPSSRNSSPCCVPASSSVSASPSSVGTTTVPPSAASAKDTSSVVIRSGPWRSKRPSSATRTTMCRSPRTPVPSGLICGGGGSPSPATRTTWPSLIPRGTLTLSFRCTGVRPAPLHSPHLSFTTVRRPWHAGQVVTMRNMPPKPCCATWPWPPQVAHSAGLVPGLAPLPLQMPHTSARLNGISRSQPSRTSRSEISTSVSRS